MPYIYSLGHEVNQTGAPYMRGLFMDFGDDPKVAAIGDEYMFGPALLVAPVTDQGMTSRAVYLPAGTDWYNFWTNEKLKGGQTITAEAPIDRIPLFVRAGSIIPMGSVVESTNEVQTIAKLKVYPGADGAFDLYRDDGTYAYEKGKFEISHLMYSEATGKVTHTGADVGFTGKKDVIEVVGK
jgi:alpha-D-xyloside xylohydrolase